MYLYSTIHRRDEIVQVWFPFVHVWSCIRSRTVVLEMQKKSSTARCSDTIDWCSPSGLPSPSRVPPSLFVNYLSWIFSSLTPCSVQDYFVRLANQKKGMLASTHLVLQSPEGTKYQAAKKWGLPAVTMRWILGSARTGRRAEEGRFLVDLPPSPGEKRVLIKTLKRMEFLCCFF